MKNKVFKLLNIVSWIGEIYCILMAIFYLIFLVAAVITPGTQGWIRQMMITPFFKVSNGPSAWMVIAVALIADIVMIVIVHYLQKMIVNLNQEKYFEQDNLQLLQRLLATVGIYTILNWVNVLLICVTGEFAKADQLSSEWVASSWNALIFLAIIYIIYLVFKSGLKLQQESDTFI